MSNWIHQVLTIPHTQFPGVDDLVERAIAIHARSGYLDGSIVRSDHVLFFLEDRYTPLFCVARSVSCAIPDTVVALAWIELMNVQSGSVILRDGCVVAYHETDCCDRFEWTEKDRVLRRYRREYAGDPRLGEFTEELDSEVPLACYSLPNCDVCDGTDCCINGGLHQDDADDTMKGDPK